MCPRFDSWWHHLIWQERRCTQAYGVHDNPSRGAIAQLVEQRTENPCVPGSIPGGTTSTLRLRRFFGEMVEWSITVVLKTTVPRGTGGSNPSLSATNAENQQIAKQTPSFAPKNVKSGVFVLFKIIQPLHNKRVAILKESDEKRLIFIYPFSLIFQDFTSS